MKPYGRRTGGRHTGGRPSAAVKSVTDDLFAVEPLTDNPAPPAVVSRVTPTPPFAVQPLPKVIALSHTKQLWYAVVFPDLSEDPSEARRTEAKQSEVPPLAFRLQRFGLSALQFTSFVSVEMPNALLLDIKGSVKLFGSLTVLHTGIDAAWSQLSMRAHSAVAPTTLAALWLARAGCQMGGGPPPCIEDPGQLASALAKLPIACMSWNPEWLQTLRAMGVTRVGELLRLPRAGVARRLNPAAVLDLDIALARQPAPRRAFIPRERYRERCDFETEIETVVYLQKALEPLILRCAQFLRERQAGVQALELRLRHRVIPMTRVRLGLASVTSEKRRLADVLDAKLSRLELMAPVRSMELLSGSLQPLSAASLDAFTGLRTGSMGEGGRDTAPQLVERLRARLGQEAVYGVASVPEHRPEAAWQRVHELRGASAAGGQGGRTGVTRASHKQEVFSGGASPADMSRPVWLLNEPVLLSADLQRLSETGLILEQGPERIESGWWDGKGVARDYYIARQIRGARWWVFQERKTKGWYLHGVFA